MANMKLIINNAGQPARELQLTSSASIGRSDDNAIRVDDASVARYHAMIEARGNEFWLSDLGSTNGTFINGVPVSSTHQLKSGDTIKIGSASTIQIIGGADHNGTANQAGTTPAPAPLPPPEANQHIAAPGLSMTHLLMAGFTVVIIIGAVAAGLIVSRGNKKPEVTDNKNFVYPTATISIPQPTATKETGKTEATSTPLPPPPQGVAGRTEQNVRLLERAISGKSYYVFEPEMLAQVVAQTSNYRVDVASETQAYRLLINQNFSNTNGLNPLYGYVLALSQSRFGRGGVGGGIGVWQVPPNIAKDYVRQGESLTNLNEPKRSAEVSAAYLKEILTKFEGQDFLYAIACYGATESSAGELRSRLEALGSPDERRNFWQMVKKGVVPREGAERVVRFLAAGIVGENPQEFGLTSPPFSQLQ